jgi:polyhydroxyalkanoate synthesis repressor PhaR
MNAIASQQPLQIRKYSNRRLYDATRSRHITADELYQLVRDGHDVVVTDSATGADITHQVLAQMIVERDSPKLEVFPTVLLHEIIRANQQMWKKFSEQWLAGLGAAITQQADAYARRVADFGWPSLDAAMLGKILSGRLEPKPPETPVTRGSAAPPHTEEDLRSAVHELQQEVRRLSSALAAGRTHAGRKRR